MVGELDGIPDEVDEDLLEFSPVSADDRLVHQHVGTELDPFGSGQWFQLFDQFAEQVSQIEGLENQIRPAALNAGEVQEIIDKIQQVLRTFANISDRLLLLIGHRAVHVVEEQFGVTDDRMNGRAKFVAAVREKFSFEPVHIFQLANLLRRHFLGIVFSCSHER